MTINNESPSYKFATRENLLNTMDYVNRHLIETFKTGCSDDLAVTLGMVQARYESLKKSIDNINDLIDNLDKEEHTIAKHISQDLKNRLGYNRRLSK